MSTVYTVEGALYFDSPENFNKAVAAFKESKLLTEDGRFRSDAGAIPQTPDGESDVGSLHIEIPYNSYRNFFDVEEETLGNASDYGVVWTTTDGEFRGGYETSELSEEFDLEKWADEHGFESPPDEDEFATQDEWFDAYVSWQSSVQMGFFEECVNIIPPKLM